MFTFAHLHLVSLCHQFEEVVGAIPHQIANSMHLWTHVELEQVVVSFQQEYEHVMFFARTVLSSMWVWQCVWVNATKLKTCSHCVSAHSCVLLSSAVQKHMPMHCVV